MVSTGELVGRACQEGVQVAELLEEQIWRVRHVLDEEGELGEDVEAGGVGVHVGVAEVWCWKHLVQIVLDLLSVHDHLATYKHHFVTITLWLWL